MLLCSDPARVLVVFGASAATIRYKGRFAGQYVARVSRVLVRTSVSAKGGEFGLNSGAPQSATLVDKDSIDRIGHLR